MVRWSALTMLVFCVVLSGCGGNGKRAGENETPAASPEAMPAEDLSADTVTAEDVKREVKEAAETFGAYADEEMQEFKEAFTRFQERAEDDIEALERKAVEGGEKTKAQWADIKAGIRKRKEAVAEKLKQVRESTADERETARRELRDAMSSLEEYLKDAAARLKGKGDTPAGADGEQNKAGDENG